MAELTPKQQRFVTEYIIDLNATQAAIRAKYSTKTAGSMGQRLLKNVEIQKAVQEAMNKRAAATEITAERVLKEIASMALLPIDDPKVVVGIVKASDKNKSLEMLGRHLGMFTDRLEVHETESSWFKSD